MGKEQRREQLHIKAKKEKLDELLEWIGKIAEGSGCPEAKKITLEICVEEIFVNIASYAYGRETGDVTVTVTAGDAGMAICFTDQGTAYDPLEKEDPDTTLSAEDRQIGGLGIYMVRQMMDEVAYEYKDGCNCFTMKLRW